MDFKQRFVDIYQSKIDRDGASIFLKWLETTDFFTSPASTRFHGSYEGGLVEHSLNVYDRLRRNVLLDMTEDKELSEKQEESIALVSLLHDVCKADYYKLEMRNKKDENNQWVQVPFYTVDNKLPYGHGEKSVYIISGFMRLSREEAMAINWHMGAFDDRVKGGSYDLSSAFESYPLAFNLHIADMMATYKDEKRK